MRHAGRTPRLVVIGGGLSGAAFAIHLLRDHGPAVEITVVEPARTLGAGLAYGSLDPAHRTNVAASRMSLFSEQPDHFDIWARLQGLPGTDPQAAMPDGRLYPRRALFGRYVDEMVQAAIRADDSRLRHVRKCAAAVVAVGGRFHIRLEDGSTLDADMLVLAVSHTAPDLPAFLRELEGDRRLVADPWRPAALATVPSCGDVLVVGTGLTGCDVIASLLARSHQGRIVAVSRRGLLPRPRSTQPVAPFGCFDEAPSRTALDLLRRTRAAVRAAVLLGRPWEDVIEALRLQARTVWGSLPVAEQIRALRHLRPFWDVHRFQSAPQIERVVNEALASGRLELLAATPLSAERIAGRIRVQLHPRGAPGEMGVAREVDAIVNCTGPGHRSVVGRHPVLQALRAADALEADPTLLGIAVDAESRVVRPDGRAWPNLFVVGPLARGRHGELMGLPQVSAQPREVAALVATLLPRLVAA